MSTSMLSAKDMTIDLLIRYGFQLMGALVVLAASALVARWVGAWMSRSLEKRTMEPPVRTLILRAVRLVVLIFTVIIALDKFGFQIAPLVAGIGVAGLGMYIALHGVQGEVRLIELFSTTLVHLDRSRVVIPNRKIVGEILHNYGALRQLPLTIDVGYGANLEHVLAAAHEVAPSCTAPCSRSSTPGTSRSPCPI